MSSPQPVMNHLRAPRAARIANVLKKSLALDFLLAIGIRMGIISSLLSIWGLGTRSKENMKLYGGPAPSDYIFTVWLLLSTGTFIPCSLLIDLALCGWITYRMRFGYDVRSVLTEFFGITSNWTSPDGVYTLALYLDFSLQTISITLISLLRVLGIGIAVCELYDPLHSQTDNIFSSGFYRFVIQSGYDWWSFERLPRAHLDQKWYRRIIRPTIWSSAVEGGPKITPWASIIFGAHTFRRRRGESAWFPLLRGILALFVLGCVGAYAISVIFIQPSQEIKTMPSQLQRAGSVPASEGLDEQRWGVVLGINTGLIPSARELDLSSIIRVVAKSSVPGAELPACSSEEVVLKSLIRGSKLKAYRLIAFSCPKTQVGATPSGDAVVFVPPILVSVHYSQLNISLADFVPERNVKVWARHTRDVPALLKSSQPVTLVAGSRVLGSAQVALRTVYSDPVWATVGLGSTQRTHVFGAISIVGPDPVAPSDIPSPETASLRLFREFQSADYDIYVDIRQHSIITGVSALGGLSILFNSLFVIVFGGSLMFVFLDVRPLNVFGLLHSLTQGSQSRRLKEVFPRLSSEGGQAGDANAGILAFLREYMLDITLVAREEAEQPKELTSCATDSVDSEYDGQDRRPIDEEQKWSSTASIHPISLLTPGPQKEPRTFFLRR